MNEDISVMKDGAINSKGVYPSETNLDDISDLIIRRMEHGYGLDVDKNVVLSQSFATKGINVGKLILSLYSVEMAQGC